MVTLQYYKTMMDDRPEKFSADDVAYREAEGKQKCSTCLHFYERKLDSFGVCEIFRPDKDEAVDPDMVCDFWNQDGDHFPLRPRVR